MKALVTMFLSLALLGTGCHNDCEDATSRSSPVRVNVAPPTLSLQPTSSGLPLVAPAVQAEPSFESACAWIWRRAELIVDIESHRGGLLHLQDQIDRAESIERDYLRDVTRTSVAIKGAKNTFRDLMTIRAVHQKLEERFAWATDDLKYLEGRLTALDLQSSAMDDIIVRMIRRRSDADVGELLKLPACIARADCSPNE